MRSNFFIIFLVVGLLSANSQVGINMINPKGIINISAKNDALLSNDLIIKVNSSGEANIVLGGDSQDTDNTSLALKETNKGLLLNRVALKSTDDQQTVPNSLDGMLIYNTNTSDPSEISNLFSVEPGVYFSQDKFWRRMYTVVSGISGEDKIAYIRDLGTTDINSSAYLRTDNPYQPTTRITNVETGAGAKLFYTRIPTTNNRTLGETAFEIPETGRFVFIFRWYGHPYSRTTIIEDNDYYVYLFKSGDSKPLAYTLVKPWLASNFNTSFSIMSTPPLNKGDKIEILMGHISSSTSAEWRLISHGNTSANRTSFVYFKYNI